MADDKKERPKTIMVFGEEIRLIEPIKCDYCKTPQNPKRYTCDHCGSQYSDSKFNIHEDHSLANKKLLN